MESTLLGSKSGQIKLRPQPTANGGLVRESPKLPFSGSGIIRSNLPRISRLDVYNLTYILVTYVTPASKIGD